VRMKGRKAILRSYFLGVQRIAHATKKLHRPTGDPFNDARQKYLYSVPLLYKLEAVLKRRHGADRFHRAMYLK
jgi:hypothetical protein